MNIAKGVCVNFETHKQLYEYVETSASLLFMYFLSAHSLYCTQRRVYLCRQEQLIANMFRKLHTYLYICHLLCVFKPCNITKIINSSRM